VKQRFIRVGDKLDDDVVAVRGGELDPEILRSDALRTHAIYGAYGVSVFAARDTTLDELAQQAPLVRFGRLTLIIVGVLRSAELRLEPTGRNFRHFTIEFDQLDEGITRLCHREHHVILNPYHAS